MKKIIVMSLIYLMLLTGCNDKKVLMTPEEEQLLDKQIMEMYTLVDTDFIKITEEELKNYNIDIKLLDYYWIRKNNKNQDMYFILFPKKNKEKQVKEDLINYFEENDLEYMERFWEGHNIYIASEKTEETN